jgi:hypothetical protein
MLVFDEQIIYKSLHTILVKRISQVQHNYKKGTIAKLKR